MKLFKCVTTAFQLYLPFLIKDFFQMISLPDALESPQSLVGQNLQWTFEVYVSHVNKLHLLCGIFFSCHGREDTHSQSMQTHRRSLGWMLSLWLWRARQRRITKEELILQTYLTQTLYCKDSVLLGVVTSLFLLLWISNQSILDSISELLFPEVVKSS